MEQWPMHCKLQPEKVSHLCIDVLVGPVNRESGSFRVARHLAVQSAK